jgi:hypothetical protein
MNKISSLNNKLSRYNKGGITTYNDTTLGWWSKKNIPTSIDDISMEIGPKYNLRPWVLAYDVYGTTDLTWVILQYNNILDITTEFTIGKTIKLPLPQRLMMNII